MRGKDELKRGLRGNEKSGVSQEDLKMVNLRGVDWSTSLVRYLADLAMSLRLGVFVMMERLHASQPYEADQSYQG